MKIFKLITFAVILIFFSSCNKEELYTPIYEEASQLEAVKFMGNSYGDPLRITLEQPNIPFHTPEHNSTVVFNDQIWSITSPRIKNGQYITQQNAVWSSSDGVNWILRKQNPFPGRSAFSITVFANKIWVFGGHLFGSSSDAPTQEVWNSSNGIHWQKVTPTNYPSIIVEETVVFNNKMFAFGYIFDNKRGDAVVYSSTNGMNWVLETQNSELHSFGAEAVVFQNHLYLIGRASLSNYSGRRIWKSADGQNWTKTISPISFDRNKEVIFSPRTNHSSVVYKNKLWVIGGTSGFDSKGVAKVHNDIWYTSDMRKWHKYDKTPKFDKVIKHTTVNFKNKIWLLNGVQYKPLESQYSSHYSRQIWSIEERMTRILTRGN